MPPSVSERDSINPLPFAPFQNLIHYGASKRDETQNGIEKDVKRDFVPLICSPPLLDRRGGDRG
jgi:hypothetical protein